MESKIFKYCLYQDTIYHMDTAYGTSLADVKKQWIDKGFNGDFKVIQFLGRTRHDSHGYDIETTRAYKITL